MSQADKNLRRVPQTGATVPTGNPEDVYSGCSETRERGVQDAESATGLLGQTAPGVKASDAVSQGHEDPVWTETFFTPKLLEREELETPSGPVPVPQPRHRLLRGGDLWSPPPETLLPLRSRDNPGQPQAFVCVFLFVFTDPAEFLAEFIFCC